MLKIMNHLDLTLLHYENLAVLHYDNLAAHSFKLHIAFIWILSVSSHWAHNITPCSKTNNKTARLPASRITIGKH